MKFLGRIFLFFLSAGVLAALAGAGIFVWALYSYGHDLPDFRALANYEPAITTRVHAGDGRLLAEFATEKRIYMPIEAVPQQVINAFLSAEDKTFYYHPGLDVFGIAKAVHTNIINMGTGKRPVGASTITQQVAKNFLLTNEVSIERKIKEAILAFRIERAYTKDEILELYLNEIYLGSGTYGVAAAALHYFNKPLNQLAIEEIAYLAALPKAPNNYHPVRKHEAAVERRNWVIDRMRDDGHVSRGEAKAAKDRPLVTTEREINAVSAPYFAEEVRRELLGHYGEKGLYEGGLSVRTSVDPKLQAIAKRTLRAGLIDYDQRHGWRGPVAHLDSLSGWTEKLPEIAKPAGAEDWKLGVVLESASQRAVIGFDDSARGIMTFNKVKWARKSLDGEGYMLGPVPGHVSDVLKPGDVVLADPSGETVDGLDVYWLRQVPQIQGGLVAMDPHTGRVLAMEGGFSFEISEYNRATQARRQPGSAFKPFVYLAAFDSGLTPATLVLDAPFVIDQGPGLGKWRPENYSGEFGGPTPIRVGLEKSKNLMTVRLANHIGMEKVVDYARKFGVVKNMEPVLSMSIGAGETTLLQMTTAYAMILNGGKRLTPTLIDRIQDRDGKTIFRHETRPCSGCGPLVKWQGQNTPDIPDLREQIADPRTTYQIVSLMEGVVQRGTGIRVKDLGRPVAGKTGTTNRSHDAWFMGFTPDLVVGVWTGFDEPRSLGKRETGSSVAAPIFRDFMKEALVGVPPIPFRVPTGIRNVQINAETGARARPGDEKVIWEAFLAGTEPSDKILMLEGEGTGPVRELDATGGTSATTGTGGLY